VSDRTNNLALPYILPSQAQKHVTHNEALQRLDAIVQLCIVEVSSAPPSDASEGQCYLVAEGAGGSWSGKDSMLALRQNGAWIYIQPGRAGVASSPPRANFVFSAAASGARYRSMSTVLFL